MPSTFMFQCVIFIVSISFAFGAEGVFDKIKSGLQNAKNYLETAKKIADLVSKSLKPKQTQKKRGDEADFNEKYEKKSFEPTNLMSTFFRLLGLDSKKVIAVTVNSFIFFAQMIGELFKITPKVEQSKAIDETDDMTGPMRLITESDNEKIKNLINQAQNEELPKQLIDSIDGFDSSCVRLLLCKTSPFIWAAQKSLKNSSMKNGNDITSWLPSVDTFEEYSDTCEERHSECELNFAH